MSVTTALDAPSSIRQGLAHPDNRGASLPAACLVIANRAVKKFVRTPALMIGGTVSGVMFLLIFRYVFGGAISHTGPVNYVDFLAPGFMVASGLFSAMSAGTGMAEDLQQGLVDRLRSLPVPAGAVVIGRVLADTLLATWGLLLTAGLSFAVGFRIHAGIGDAVAAFGLAVLWAMVFCWLFTALGMFAGSAQGAQSLSFLVFPLTFVSSAYVPVQTMPGWMQAFARNQPITAMVDVARILAQGPRVEAGMGHDLSWYLMISLAWSLGILLVCVPLAAWRLGRR